jgi:hypothetical protein
MKKNKFIKKKIKGIVVDVRSKSILKYWVIYIDNSTNEKIVNRRGIIMNTQEALKIVGGFKQTLKDAGLGLWYTGGRM